MGCGGSRADAIIEPRYHESWTRETESTWLTNTDVDTPTSIPNSTFCCSFYPLKHPTLQKKNVNIESNTREKRMVTTGTQCGKQALTSNGSNQQRRTRRSLSDVGVTGGRGHKCLMIPHIPVSFCIYFSHPAETLIIK
uniref:Brain and acute leukemia cytoplasmic protein n=1 Tax=Oryzias sinensis TaxID=183150 RepID=A0A8C7X7S8_9TELE